MKKLIFTLLLMMFTLGASANSIRYFTLGQATRTVNYLNQQNELMIFCGYEYEVPTYVLLSDVWMEPYNSKYYELWIYGWDAYTGEEIYMPIDLGCIWLYHAGARRYFSAAQTLRFNCNRVPPTFAWTMPPYNPYVRHPHPVHYHRTYHYDVHVCGWQVHYGYHTHLHPYYMCDPYHNVPVYTHPYTPGVDKPQVPQNYKPQPVSHSYTGGERNERGNNSNYSGSRTQDANRTGNSNAVSGSRNGNSSTPTTGNSTSRTGSSMPSSANSGSRNGNNVTPSTGNSGSRTNSSVNTNGASSSRGGVSTQNSSSRTSTTSTPTQSRGNVSTSTTQRSTTTETKQTSVPTSTRSTSSTGTSTRGTTSTSTQSSTRGTSGTSTQSSTRGTTTRTTNTGSSTTRSRN